MNPFSDFHMFAKAPVAGHIVGMILDDLANEFDPYSPSFGEKYAPPFMPVSIRDYAGNEINRVYSRPLRHLQRAGAVDLRLQRADAVGRGAEHGATCA